MTNPGGDETKRSLANRRNAIASRMSAGDMKVVDGVAAALAGPDGSAHTLFQARAAAEAGAALRRVAELRGELIQNFVEAREGDNECTRMSELLGQLWSLERYERRAFSRRKKAIRLLPAR